MRGYSLNLTEAILRSNTSRANTVALGRVKALVYARHGRELMG